MKFSQAPNCVVMVRPRAFGFNAETALTNSFQQTYQGLSVHEQAIIEFDTMVDLLRSNDVDVMVVDDTAVPQKPDAIFPNNWISFHHDGTVVLYPMLAENRRAERLIPVLDSVKSNRSISQIIDLTQYELEGKFLEGTGSIVFDYENQIAYAARSARTNEEVLEQLCKKLNFKPVVFDAVDENNQPIYHTNVLLCVGSKFVILCLDAIHSEADQEKLLLSFEQTNHRVIAISYSQLKLFAGNMLEVSTQTGEPIVLISQQAYEALLPGQLNALSMHAEPVPIAIPVIEHVGGGSVRCMMAAVFNPVL